MRHIAYRVSLIILITLCLIVYIIPWHSYGINIPFTGSQDYRLGLDLQGGIELDYKVDFSELRESPDFDKNEEKAILEGLKSIIDKRVETLNINDSEINDASYGGESHIIVQIPLKGNDNMENLLNIERAKEAIGKVVKIQFKERRKGITEDDLLERKLIAENALKEIQNGEKFSVVSDKYGLTYENVLVGDIPSLDDILKDISNVSVGTLNDVELKTGDKGYLLIDENTPNNLTSFIYVSASPSEWMPAMDSKGRILDDKYFVKSSVQFNEAYKPMVELTFNSEGAEIFAELTRRLVGQQMAIFVGGEMLTAPNINEPIPGGKAVITGQYTVEEAKELSQNINTGVVPAPIYLTSEKTIDSKIGVSSLGKLITAGIAGFVLIFIFLIAIYRVSGLMASLALLIYAILILAIVKIFGVVLTMASIAGLILSVGMAIDANILIFERIREKLEDGETLLDATDAGFKESWSAIWDSNLTGIFVAVILFVFGINMIKGFGLMLGIGLVLSLFTVMWISRVFILGLALSTKNKKLFIGYKK